MNLLMEKGVIIWWRYGRTCPFQGPEFDYPEELGREYYTKIHSNGLPLPSLSRK